MPPGRRRAVNALVLLVTLVTSACSSGSHPAAGTSPSPVSSSAAASASAAPGATPASPALVAHLDWHACDQGMQCATLPVPLDDRNPPAGTIRLAVARHPATGHRLGSLLVNPGGPGASAIDFLEGQLSGFPAEVRAAFDLVAVDPRGVGRSDPIRCESTAQLDAYFHVNPAPSTPAEVQAFEQANSDFERGCATRAGRLLPYVSTAAAAEDMDRLRAALHEPRLNYLGYSYGTAIGAAYLERYPTHVRTMVLDGALDPALTWDQLLRGQALGFDRELAAFLADCQRTNCPFRQSVSGDLGAAYDALAKKVSQQPLQTSAGRTVGPGEFSLGVTAGLYSRNDGWPAIAQALSYAERGDGSALLTLSDSYTERGPNGYSNVTDANVAVNCLDRPWPHSYQPYFDLANQVRKVAPRFGPAIALSGASCESWPVPPAGTPHLVHAAGAPPVLVIGSTGDPATPFVWAQRLAAELSSGVLLTHRGDGHTVYRTGAPSCVVAPVDHYLLTAAPPSPSTC